MYASVCLRPHGRARVRTNMYVYAYLCNVCVCGELGRGGRGLCVRLYTCMLLCMFTFINLFCFPVCVY